MVLSGEADLLMADAPSYDGARPIRAKAGDFAYYPPGHHHTIRNPGTLPVTYMMFRWRTRGTPKPTRLEATLFRAPPPPQARPGRGFVTRPVLSAPTMWLRNLTCHMSRLEPGAGYAPHADPYDVAILVHSGRVRTLSREVGPGGLVYCSAGRFTECATSATSPRIISSSNSTGGECRFQFRRQRPSFRPLLKASSARPRNLQLSPRNARLRLAIAGVRYR